MTPFKKNYADKLRDPRWQRKRLQILQRDDFTCQRCMKKDIELHVHHCMYKPGREPWEYHERLLVTLCKNCHLLLQRQISVFVAFITEKLLTSGIVLRDEDCVDHIADLVNRMEEHQND